MNSEDDIEDISNKLSASTSYVDFLSKFKEHHSILFANLVHENTEKRSKILEILQKYCKIVCESDLPDRIGHVFIIIPRLSSFVEKVISDIDVLLNLQIHRTEPNVKIVTAYQQITEVLTSLGVLLKGISSSNCQPTLQNHAELVIHTSSILLVIFQHCQKYEMTCNEFSSSINEHISALFKKCNEIQSHYIDFLHFLLVDCQNIDDLNRLAAIIDKMFHIGVAVSNLDLKTMAQLWKGFMSLLESYAVHLRNQFDLTPIIEFLYKEIAEKIKVLSDDENINTNHKKLALRVSSFLLKIIVKLCQCWRGNLEKCVASLLELTLFLYEHSIACSKYSKANYKLIEEIDRSLLASLDLLINVLVHDCSFIRWYSAENIREVTNKNETGVLLLLCQVLQKIMSCDEDVRNQWISCGILHVSLNMISEFHKNLFLEIKVPNTFCGNTTLPCEIFLYDTLMINLSSLIICYFSGDLFSVVENTLVTHFVKSPILVQILISDVWCIIERYGNSNLCLNHVLYLLSLWNELYCEKSEALVLASLINRLFKILSPNHQVKLITEANENILFILKPEKETLVVRHITEKARAELNDMKRISNATFQEAFKFLQLTTIVRRIETNTEDEFDFWMKDFLLQQWDTIVEMLVGSRIDNLNQLLSFIFNLSCVTSSFVKSLNAVHILRILRSINELLRGESSQVCLNVLRIFKSLAHYRFDNSHVAELSTMLEAFFKICLQNRNPILKQYSLETFSYFSHITTHEIVIQKTLANEPTLRETMAMYLQKKPHKLEGEKTLEKYIEGLLVFTTNDRSEEENCVDHVTKKIKLDYSVVNKIKETEIVFRDLMKIVSYKVSLDGDEKSKLRALVYNVDKLRSKIA